VDLPTTFGRLELQEKRRLKPYHLACVENRWVVAALRTHSPHFASVTESCPLELVLFHAGKDT
jgi:hypothetical protein